MPWKSGRKKISVHVYGELLYEVLPTDVSCSFSSSTLLAA